MLSISNNLFNYNRIIEKINIKLVSFIYIKMNIIISGAFGHIGSFLINKFKNDKRIKNVLLIDNFSTQR